MQHTDIPANKFSIPWANDAGGSYIRTIPTNSQIGIQDGAASLQDGYPPLNFLPVGSGGVPPFGQDSNGILFEMSSWNRWQQVGGPVFYDATFATAVGGYPKGALLTATALDGTLWYNQAENNTSNPDTGGANWLHVKPGDYALLDAANTFGATPQNIQLSTWGEWRLTRNAVGTWGIGADNTTNAWGIYFSGVNQFSVSSSGVGNFANNSGTLSNLGGVPTSRNISAGTGLTGGGNLTADRTLTVVYGTTSGTAAQGNDSRITGAVQKSSRHVSSNFTFAASGSGSEAHGLSGGTIVVDGWLLCISPNQGYAAGDVVHAPQTNDTTTDRGFTFWADNSNIGFGVGSGGVSIIPKGGGAVNLITVADWEVFMVAEVMP